MASQGWFKPMPLILISPEFFLAIAVIIAIFALLPLVLAMTRANRGPNHANTPPETGQTTNNMASPNNDPKAPLTADESVQALPSEPPEQDFAVHYLLTNRPRALSPLSAIPRYMPDMALIRSSSVCARRGSAEPNRLDYSSDDEQEITGLMGNMAIGPGSSSPLLLGVGDQFGDEKTIF